MASEITNKSSGQVMRVCFTVFSLDSLSLSLSLSLRTIKFSNDYSIQSPTCYISFNRDKYIEETSKLPIFPSRKRVHALSMQWNLNVPIVFDTAGQNVVRDYYYSDVQTDSSRTGNSNFSCRAICSPIIIPRPPLSRCTQGVNFYYDFQLPIHLVPLNPSPSLSLSLSPCFLLFLSYHRNSRLACFTRLSSANNARSFVDLSN